MAEPFLAEIRLFSFTFAPRGWALCNGQLLPISQNQALYSLLGTSFGGNGSTNFALPNLQARVPIHTGSTPSGTYVLGQAGGAQTHALSVGEMPPHGHTVYASTGPPDLAGAPGAYWAASAGAYASASNAAMSNAAIAAVGGAQAHQNFSPYLVITICIALQGIYPSPS